MTNDEQAMGSRGQPSSDVGRGRRPWEQGTPDRWYDHYEPGRPGWPPQVVDIPELTSAASVLDLGAGTGKLTRVLVSRFRRVLAVEPDERMRRLLVASCPEAEVLPGSAEQIPLAEASVDAVYAAQAFHWFDREHALGEIARVLVPRGALVLMWNIPAGPVEPSIAAVEQLLDERGLIVGNELMDMNPWRLGLMSDDWRLTFADSPFDEELQEARLPNLQTVDRDGLVAFFASMGWIDGLPDADRLPLLDEVRSLLTSAEYRCPWETHVYWTRLAAPPESPT